MELTKSADKVLCIVYKAYLSRLKFGAQYEDAVYFDCNFYDTDQHASAIDESAFNAALQQLGDAGYIRRYIDGGFMLLPAAIAHMENRFKKGLKEVLETIAGFIP